MLRIDKVIKQWKDAAALCDHLNLYGFWNETAFLTKSGDLGTSVHPDLLSSRFGYVTVSRASHEAIIFTNDINRLAQQFSTEVSKTAALEMGQGIPKSRDQSVGMSL